MPLARAAAMSRGLSRTVLRRAGSSARNQSWRYVGRRGYASDHGHQESSEIPWIIGSAVFFFPSAAWLLGQSPVKGDHGHDSHHEKHNEEAEAVEAKEAEQDDAPKEESDQEQEKEEAEDKERVEGEEKADKDGEGKDESGDKDEEAADGPSSNAPKQINYDSSSGKGPGEGQKGERKPSQKKGEKDAQGDFSGAQHPYLDDAEKSKKGIGVTETAKIHGTVDPKAPAR